MVNNIPVRFKRVAAAFGEVSRSRSCESSGSEHSADLSDLVNSFLEKEIRERYKYNDQDISSNEINDNDDDDESESNSQEFEFQDTLKNLFDCGKDDDVVKWNIHSEVENVLREVGESRSSSPDFKRSLMARLHDRGFDAGLCKSKWDKIGRCPSGDYDYIDINASGTRYIIEVNLAGQFTIARPAESFKSLLETFPMIFVGKPDELKKVMRLMCNAIRVSMKRVDIHVPPWRRLAYLQAKWFGSYKRTSNEISSRKGLSIGGDFTGNRSVGFAVASGFSLYCKEEFVVKNVVRIGNLSAALEH